MICDESNIYKAKQAVKYFGLKTYTLTLTFTLVQPFTSLWPGAQ